LGNFFVTRKSFPRTDNLMFWRKEIIRNLWYIFRVVTHSLKGSLMFVPKTKVYENSKVPWITDNEHHYTLVMLLQHQAHYSFLLKASVDSIPFPIIQKVPKGSGCRVYYFCLSRLKRFHKIHIKRIDFFLFKNAYTVCLKVFKCCAKRDVNSRILFFKCLRLFIWESGSAKYFKREIMNNSSCVKYPQKMAEINFSANF